MIVAGMATIPPRAGVLKQAVASIAPQVDLLFLHLNQADPPPWLVEFPNVRPLFSKVTRIFDANAKFWYADSRKFLGLKEPEQKETRIFLTCDDDIVYPSNYVSRMSEFMDSFREPIAVAVHGARIQEPIKSYHECLQKYRFAEALPRSKRVHIGGTGTLMFRPRDIPINFEELFGYPNMTDVWFAIHAKTLGVPLWCINREALWLKPIKVNKGIYETRSHGWAWVETHLLQEAAPWPTIEELDRVTCRCKNAPLRNCFGYFCQPCDVWLEDNCDNKKCVVCFNRPAKPSGVKSKQ